MKFASFKSSALKSVGAVSLCVALGAGLVGCGGNGAGGGAVAATVNGQEIMEQTVTDYIANFRTSSSLESDEAWGEWMVANGYTPESVREEVIDYYVNQDLYDQAAKEYNVTVEQADIDAALDETKAMFESDEAFQEALEASSMTEESYIEDVIRPNLLQTKLAEAVAAQDTEGEGDDATLAQAQAMSEQFNEPHPADRRGRRGRRRSGRPRPGAARSDQRRRDLLRGCRLPVFHRHRLRC